MAELLSSNVTGTLNVTQNTAVSGNLLVQTRNIVPAIDSAANTVRVSQNSGSTLSSKQLNFVNTATATVEVSDSGTGNANIAITVIGGGGGIQGAVGAQGIQGAQGPQGIQGQAGPQGIQGQAGPQGIQGFAGPQGVQGLQGPQGVQGLGVQGVQGQAGPQGVQGVPGTNGTGGTFPVSSNSSGSVTANAINFVNTSTVTVTVSTGIDGNANVALTSTGGAGVPGGSNTNIQYNNDGSFAGSNNLIYNAASQAISTNGNVVISNIGGLYFGASQTSPTISSSKISVQYNVTASSLDFTFLG